MTQAGKGLKSGVRPAGTPATTKNAGSALATFVGIIWTLIAIVTALGLAAAPSANGGAQFTAVVLTLISGLLGIPPAVAALRRRVAFMRPTAVPPILAVVIFFSGWFTASPHIQLPPAEPTTAQPAAERVSSRPPSNEPFVVEEDAATETEIRAMWAEVERLTASCDAATDVVARSVEGASGIALPGLYTQAERGQRICGQAGVDVKRVRPPRSLSRAERREFDQALDLCGDAYLAKSIMLGDMRSVIDGDRRPSQLARLQQAGSQSRAQTFACVLRMTELAQAQGVDLTPEGSAS